MIDKEIKKDKERNRMIDKEIKRDKEREGETKK
jgi:hypothetical protein